MRDIKFKAWHKKRKKFYKVIHLYRDSYDELWATCEGYDIIEQRDMHIDIQPEDCIIVIYTGKKDKNGKEIYEGDICLINWHDARYENYYGEVVWNKDEAAWDFGAGCVSEVGWSHEVVGNIYKNPELLSGKYVLAGVRDEKVKRYV